MNFQRMYRKFADEFLKYSKLTDIPEESDRIGRRYGEQLYGLAYSQGLLGIARALSEGDMRGLFFGAERMQLSLACLRNTIDKKKHDLAFFSDLERRLELTTSLVTTLYKMGAKNSRTHVPDENDKAFVENTLSFVNWEPLYRHAKEYTREDLECAFV